MICLKYADRYLLGILEAPNELRMGRSKKSRKNKEKHGLTFREATAVWDDPNGVEFPALTIDEQRFARIAKFDGKTWVIIWTPRNGKIRIISARRA